MKSGPPELQLRGAGNLGQVGFTTMVAHTSASATPSEESAADLASAELARRMRTVEPSPELARLAAHSNRSVELHDSGQVAADSFLQVTFAQLSLPYLDPGASPFWERTNGTYRMTIQPGVLTAKDGSRRAVYPYGVVPRMFLIWLSTEVLRTQNQTISLGDSFESLMRNLGITSGGKQRRNAMEQLRRLLACSITVEKVVSHGDTWQATTARMNVADSFDLWFSGSDHAGHEPLSASTLTLGDTFYRAILESSLPLSSAVLRELRSVPMQIDIYVWLVHRMYRVQGESNVSWKQLQAQFGADYARLRDFKRRFLENLAVVRCYYPDSRVTDTPDGLILRKSKRHISSSGRPTRLSASPSRGAS
jgi:hypothetical protein